MTSAVQGEREAISRAEQQRDRLKREAEKRGYLKPDSSSALAEQRVPDCTPAPGGPALSEEQVAEGIKRHIDSIKARRQRMHDCALRLNDMMDLRETLQRATGRGR